MNNYIITSDIRKIVKYIQSFGVRVLFNSSLRSCYQYNTSTIIIGGDILIQHINFLEYEIILGLFHEFAHFLNITSYHNQIKECKYYSEAYFNCIIKEEQHAWKITSELIDLFFDTNKDLHKCLQNVYTFCMNSYLKYLIERGRE